MTITFKINGQARSIEVFSEERLLDIIRDQLHFTGTKEGCGIGECGACTVLLNGQNVNSCLVPAIQVDGAEILTIEGVGRFSLGKILQESYIEAGAVQCGFCIPGMIISSYALLQKNPCPTQEEIQTALSGNLCRCTGYVKIIRAVQMAAERWNAQKEGR